MDLGETLRVAAWSSENKWGRGHCVGCHHRFPASLLHVPNTMVPLAELSDL